MNPPNLIKLLEPKAPTRFAPRVTVAAIVCRDEQLLMVQEYASDGIRINQPAGHLDPGETLLQAVVRETLEESAWRVEPQAVLGLYMSRYFSQSTAEFICYLRVAFICQAIEHTGSALDPDIIQAFWASPADILARQPEHRSPLVAQCILDWQDLQSGRRSPMALDHIYTHPSVVM